MKVWSGVDVVGESLAIGGRNVSLATRLDRITVSIETD